jgi:hypothetical protein
VLLLRAMGSMMLILFAMMCLSDQTQGKNAIPESSCSVPHNKFDMDIDFIEKINDSSCDEKDHLKSKKDEKTSVTQKCNCICETESLKSISNEKVIDTKKCTCTCESEKSETIREFIASFFSVIFIVICFNILISNLRDQIER